MSIFKFSMHSNCSFKMKLITKKEAGFEPGTSWTLSNKTGKINVTLKWDKVVSTGLWTHDLLHKDWYP